jgi:hypothetical protein
MNRARPHGISARGRRQAQEGVHVLASTRPKIWIAHTINGAFSAVCETIRTFKDVFNCQLSTVTIAPYEKSIGYCTSESPLALPSIGLTYLTPLVPLSH